MRVEDGREIPAGQRTVNLCHGQGAKIHLFHSIRPPLRSHTTLTVANVICFIHRPCVCVSASEKSWYAEWNKKKCFVMLWTLPSSPAFTFFTVSRWMQLIFHIFKRLSTSSTPSRLLEKRLFVLPRRCLVEYLPQPFAILRSEGLRENLNVFMWKFNYAKKSH